MNYSCKVNSKGQITIPSQIRKMLDIREEDVLMAKVTEKGVIVLEGGKDLKVEKNIDKLVNLLDETFAAVKKREEFIGGFDS